MKNRLTDKQIEYGLLWLLIAGFGVVYLSLCFNHNVWTDEAFTIELLKDYKSFGEIAAYTARDVHPPLYYWILHPFAQLFGVHLFLLKVLSIVPMLLTMLFGITFVRPRFGFKSSLLYILMTGVIPCSMEYAVQVRMYSWALLFVTACGIYAVYAYERGRKTDWLMLMLAGVAAAYTHYFAFAAVLWIYGFLFLALCIGKRGKLRWWLLSVITSVVLYLPWAFSLMRQVNNVSESYWIGEITGEVILSYFDWLFETDLPHAALLLQILFGIAFVRVIYRLVRKKADRPATLPESAETPDSSEKTDMLIALLSLLVLIATAAAGIVISNLMRPVFIARYLLPCIGLLALFFGIAMRDLEKKTYIALLAFCMLLGLLDYKRTFYQEYKATYTAQTEQFLEENLGENDIIAYNFKDYGFIYEYYWDKEKLQYVEDVDLGHGYDNIWFLDTHFNPEFSQEELAAHGYTMTYEGNYGIEHDEFKIYRLRKND